MDKRVVYLKQIVDQYELKPVYLPEDYPERKIDCCDVNRPGLQLAGYFDYFDNTRLQIVGREESTFLGTLSSQERRERLDRLMARHIPAMIVTRELNVFEECLDCAKKYQVPLLRTHSTSSRFMASLIAYLNHEMAERITRHGVLVDVYGEGVLILGDSGVGKSETAIELVKRGHRLIADDAVEIKKTNDHDLYGSAPAIIRHFIELRGIGIVDVKNIYGIGAVKDSTKIDMVIQMETWDENKCYDRLGMDNNTTDILGVEVPMMLIPVKPGRNLAVIIEVAAMNNRQRKLGYNAAQELNRRLMNQMEEDLAARSEAL
ncbi:MAG: HPr(Ser) kinase/phosphatase [Eubacteriales bacterium]